MIQSKILKLICSFIFIVLKILDVTVCTMEAKKSKKQAEKVINFKLFHHFLEATKHNY